MNCAKSKKLIQLYMDNELSPRESLEVQQHLEACAPCTTLLDYFIRQDDVLRTIAKATPSDNARLREGVRAALRDPHRSLPMISRRVWWRRPALWRAAAVVVVAVTAAFFFLRGSTPFNDKVYADAVRDHDHHCTLDVLSKFEKQNLVFSNRDKINQMVASYSTMKEVPDISAFGYGEPRAVICALDGKKTLHVVYQSESPSQQPLSIFIRLRDGEMVRDKLLELSRDQHRLASLSRNDTEMVVVAAPDEARTPHIASAIAAQFTK